MISILLMTLFICSSFWPIGIAFPLLKSFGLLLCDNLGFESFLLGLLDVFLRAGLRGEGDGELERLVLLTVLIYGSNLIIILRTLLFK